MLRLGLYPGGYSVRSTRYSISSLDDPFSAGPMGPSFEGSRLWHATQFARYTARPRCQSGSFAAPEELSESLEQALITSGAHSNKMAKFACIRCTKTHPDSNDGANIVRRRIYCAFSAIYRLSGVPAAAACAARAITHR